MGINERLSDLVELKKVNQTELALICDVSKQAISSLLKGNTKPSIKVIENLAKKYDDLSVRWLLTGEGEMLLDAIPAEKQNGDCPGSGECENCKRLNDFIANQERLIDRLYNLLDNNRLGGGGGGPPQESFRGTLK